ncbi:MAG: DUF1295 domain-containing protein [Clostridia bacterium]|nr:DUF1295 domain-containing protein [Clostridia bacterium]
MKKALTAVILGLSLLACPILYFAVGPALDEVQLGTLKLLLIVCGSSALFCFVVGELSKNNSQMDKLWSILPIAYTWIIAVRGGMSARLIVIACLVTLWGARLTFNFARKGAYRLKFWTGEEDYRWKVLREKKEFRPRWKWTLFDLFFICIYQNALVLATTLPALISMRSEVPFGAVDGAAAALMLGFIVLETVADEQQWAFHSKKKELLAGGKKLGQIPEPWKKGFNTTGLWGHSRHPNYFAEQSIWVSLYIFSIGAGIGIFNWSVIGALLLIVLFMGSSNFGEEISSSKYPLYAEYKRRVSKFVPWFGTMEK